MKKSKIISVFLLLLLSSNISFADTGIVNTPAVRIREKASTDAEIITKAYEDDEVEILGEEGDWYQVKFEGKTGYASKSLINKKEEASSANNTTEPATNTETNTTSNENTSASTNTTSNTTTEQPTTPPAPASTVPTETGNNIKDDVVARRMPNFGSNEVILLTKGTVVEVLGELNNWIQVSSNGVTGWILKNKLTSEAVEVATQEPTDDNTSTANTNTSVDENTTTAQTNIVSNTTTNNTTTNSTNTTTNSTNTSTNSTSTDVRNQKGKINVETANVREKASTGSDKIGSLDVGDEVTILEEEGDFYKIKGSGIDEGYVSKKLVTILNVSSRSDIRESEEPVVQGIEIQDKATEVANYAKQYLGCSYVLGGKTPESGFDCSGFTRYVFKNFGYSLGTVAADQNSLGTEIERSNLKVGDLILFYNEENSKIGHTGIYIGDNEFIHAANPERGVVIDNLETNSYYSSRFVTARRIVE